LVDIKTSNYIHTSHELQVAAYATAWNEKNQSKQIDATAILWLKPSIRTDKIDYEKQIFQGVSVAGAWQLKLFPRSYKESFEIFKHSQAIWKEENPKWIPANKTFPDFIKL